MVYQSLLKTFGLLNSKNMIIELKCRFCEKVTGTHDLPAIVPVVNPITGVETYPNITEKNLGIVDVRCGECQETKGSFQDMEEVARIDLGLSNSEFAVLVERADGDVKTFTEIIVSEKPEKTLNRELRGGVEARKVEVVTELGLSEKEPDVAIRAVKRAMENAEASTLAELKTSVSAVLETVEEEYRAEVAEKAREAQAKKPE